MQSKAADVDAYIAEASAARQEVLSALRDLCRATLVGFDETMIYGMASYRRRDTVEIAFANQKQYIALYVLRTNVADAHRDRLGGLDVGKSCVRYKRPEQIDFDVVRSMLDATVRSTGKVC